MIYKFYDTSSLLLKAGNLFDDEENIVFSSITLEELEHIKTSSNKDQEVKHAAREVLRQLDDNPDRYEVWIYKNHMIAPIEEKDLSVNNDMKILASAIDYDTNVHPDETVFVTNDLSLKKIANLFFGNDSIESIDLEADNYTGFKEVYLSDDEMNDFYSNPENNMFDLYINQYLLVFNKDKELVDRLCWTGEGYRHLDY